MNKIHAREQKRLMIQFIQIGITRKNLVALFKAQGGGWDTTARQAEAETSRENQSR